MENEKHSPNGNGKHIFIFLQKSYDETLSLITLSRDYFVKHGQNDKEKLSKEDSIAYTLAMSTITTQLTSILGWLLMCRAVQNGEITMSELKSDDFAMPEFDLDLNDRSSCFATLNEPIRSILARSSKLYNRIKRMENSIQNSL